MTPPPDGDRRTPQQPTRARWLGRVWAVPTGRFGICVVVGIILVALIAWIWTPFDPQQVNVQDRWLPPSWPHLLARPLAKVTPPPRSMRHPGE